MNDMSASPTRYAWFALGDVNGFFGLMFDNLTVLSFMAGTLVLVFRFPADVVYTRMFPGTAFGVLLGDLVYTWLAFRLAKRTGRGDVTAMPLGLDTPSTIGMTLIVLGPAFVGLKAEGMSERDAAMMTWYIGMATMVMIGLFKVVLSFVGQWVQRAVPQAGLLGSLAGIGLALIGLAPLVDVFGMPVIGMISLGLILYALVAGIRLPGNVPGVLGAIVLGSVLYYVFGASGWMGGTYAGPPVAALHFGLPMPTLAFTAGLTRALKYLPISIPFGLLTVVGGINVTESARVAGDDYSTRSILLTEAIATLLAGVCGGVAQSTPYIGQPAYKRMGARAGYTLLTGIFIGLGGVLGYVSFFVELIPRSVLAPILIFVAIEIAAEAFRECPARHAPAVAFAFFPTVARLISIRLGNPDIVPPENLQRLLEVPGRALPDALVTIAIGNGFILTAMLWGGFLAELIDRRVLISALYLVALASLTFFGVIHSASPDGVMYLPWNLPPIARQIPYQFTLAYLVLAGVLAILAFANEPPEPAH
jgi:AGZA family xanthine/uracil permease-like MFS transporter